jgi:TRAP-type mannitol/chloroaromatic compound transport system permease large subunit
VQLGVFDMSNLRRAGGRYTGYMINEVLVAVPLFIFMGLMLERSRIAEQLLSTMGRLFGDMRGGSGSRSSSWVRCSRPRPASSARPS